MVIIEVRFLIILVAVVDMLTNQQMMNQNEENYTAHALRPFREQVYVLFLLL